MTKDEANTVMEVIYQLEHRRSYYGLDQDQTMLKHLYGLHKLRDEKIQEWVEDYFVDYDDVENYKRLIRMAP